MIYEFEKQLRENGDKLSDEDKAKVQSEIDAFKKVREGGKADEIKSAMEGFTQRVYDVFGKIYKQQAEAQGAQGAQGPQAGTTNDDGSINTEGEVH